jgi:hypothetical protein
MSSARSTAPWPCCWLWWFALACATQRINRLSKHLTRSLGPNYSLDDSTTASAGLQLCRASARDAHRRPPSAGIRQHEETGNSRACKLPISAGFFFCCCLDELAVRGCLLRLNMAYHSRRTARTRRSSPVNRWFYCFVPSTRKNRPVEVSVGRWLDAALPRVSMSPPHARAAKPWKGSSLVRQSRGYRPEHRKSGESSHFPGTQAYWTVRQLLTGRANVFCESRL